MPKDNKAKIEIEINGESFPCRPTMGAMLRFKRETGKEATDITGSNISELCTYIYCCVASASAADNIKFDMSLMEFVDAIDPEDLAAWMAQMPQETAENKKK